VISPFFRLFGGHVERDDAVSIQQKRAAGVVAAFGAAQHHLLAKSDGVRVRREWRREWRTGSRRGNASQNLLHELREACGGRATGNFLNRLTLSRQKKQRRIAAHLKIARK